MKKTDEIKTKIKSMQIDLERLIDSKGGIIDSEVLAYSKDLDSIINQFYFDQNKIRKRNKWLGKTRQKT